MKIMDFLKKQIVSSLIQLVRLVAKNLRGEQIDVSAMVTMIKAIKVALVLIPVEGLIGYLQTLVVCRYAEKGTEVPKEIADLFVVVLALPPAVKTPPVLQEVLAARVLPLAPIHQVPPRKLEPTVKAKDKKPAKTIESNRDTLMGILQNFISGRKTDFDKTMSFIASVFNSGVELRVEHWQTLLDALRFSWERNIRLLDKSISSRFFDCAPPDLLRQTLFGDDGLVVMTIAQLSEVASGQVPPALVAKTFVAVDAADAIDRGKDGVLRDNEIARLAKLKSAILTAQGPDRLLEKIEEILYCQEVSKLGQPASASKSKNQQPTMTAMEIAFQKASVKNSATA